MPTNRNKCDEEVKLHFKHCHSKCQSNGRKGKALDGSYLNRFIHLRPFQNKKQYQTCYTLHRAIQHNDIRPLTKEERDKHIQQSLLTLQRDGAIAVPTVSPSEVIDEQAHQKTTERENRLSRRRLLRDHHSNKGQEQINNNVPPPINETPPPTNNHNT